MHQTKCAGLKDSDLKDQVVNAYGVRFSKRQRI